MVRLCDENPMSKDYLPPELSGQSVAEYTRDMLGGLRRMAKQYDLKVLERLLEVSEEEAARIARARG